MLTLPVKGSGESYNVDPRKIICLGLNYHEHIEESLSIQVQGLNKEAPKEPILFPKTPNALQGPDQPIVLPRILESYGFHDERTDYEGELAILIGREAKEVAVEDAAECIFGYTCANDVSQRNIQNGDRSGWFRGKSFDGFAPVGPQIVKASDIGNVLDLHVETRRNGEVVQSSSTKLMVFNVYEIVSFVSRNVTLTPGDIILSGTPGGVGPIAHGDVIEVEIEEIGVLRNSVVDPRRT
jgi:2-keto-4-pentenoate hydratase/2-oxohepta-3-ene-1,7-dioic acid hydratase in catechol pathway